MRFLMLFLVAFSFYPYTQATQAAPFTLSKSVRCNPKQTQCVIRTNRLTIGDRIGFFNRSGELLAKGVVKSIKDENRIVKITDSYAKVGRFSLVDILSSKRKYKMVKGLSSLRVGGNLGFGSYNTSGNVTAWEISGFGAWSNKVFGFELPSGLSLVARASFMTGSKDLARTIGVERLENTFSMTGFGLLGGLAYEFFNKSTVSARFEGSFGGSMTGLKLGSLDLSDEDVKDAWDVELDDGFNLLVHGSLNILYNGFPKWHPMVGASITVHGGSTGRTIWLGLMRDID